LPDEFAFEAGVDAAPSIVLVPESACRAHSVVSVGRKVVVTVIRSEHHPTAVAECIVAGVTRVPGRVQHVVGRFIEYNKRTVLGPVPATITCLQVKSQLGDASLCQLTEQVVADPVVAFRIVESCFVLRPGTIEVVGIVNFLLNW